MINKNSVIINYLIEHRNEELNILMISKALKMDYKNVYSIIKRLEKESIIKLESFGKSSRVKLIFQQHPLIFETEHNRRKELLKNKNIIVMLNDLKSKIKSKFFILLIFGSYAKKTQNKNSDIDLMFIVPNNSEEFFEKEINKAIISLPLPIHNLVFTEKQFLEMINAKEQNVGKEALNNNIILYGIETYYELIT